MLRLMVKVDSPIPIETDIISPDQLAGMPAAVVAQQPILFGNRTVSMGDVFRCIGICLDGYVEIIGDCSRIKGLGRGMKTGKLAIFGDAGTHTGAQMSGGELEVHGDAGDWCGAEMRGGFLRVLGKAGDCLGAAYRGSPKGMRGGTIFVDADAGSEVGANMRRGTIAIGGKCGEFAGTGMIAGSILAFGGTGPRVGAGMKRGTILSGAPTTLPPTFAESATFDPVFLRVYLQTMIAWELPVPREWIGRPVRSYRGDQLALGKGEVLVPA